MAMTTAVSPADRPYLTEKILQQNYNHSPHNTLSILKNEAGPKPSSLGFFYPVYNLMRYDKAFGTLNTKTICPDLSRIDQSPRGGSDGPAVAF
jgi:hypothetical protein